MIVTSLEERPCVRNLFMDVIDLTGRNGVAKSEINFRQIIEFLKRHRDHGSYTLTPYFLNGELKLVLLECFPFDIIRGDEKCPVGNGRYAVYGSIDFDF